MKNAIISFLFIVVLMACNSSETKGDDSITGIYIQEIDGEFAKGTDSLIVTILDKDAGTYTIENNYSFVRYLDGKEKGPGRTSKKYTVVYDKEHKQLTDNFKGMIFTWVPEKGLLLKGSAEYRKIK